MSRIRRYLVGVGVVTILLGGVAADRVARVYTGPPLPVGATRLHIATASPGLTLSFGCATALLMPARVATSGDALILINVETGNEVKVVWPSGFAAWRRDGRAELADPWGSVLGREGQVFSGLGGGMATDDAFGICPWGLPKAS